MNLQEMTLDELKAKGYELYALIEINQKQIRGDQEALRALHTEVAQRMKEEKKD